MTDALRGTVLALARPYCYTCEGSGIQIEYLPPRSLRARCVLPVETTRVCRCVAMRAFRTVYGRAMRRPSSHPLRRVQLRSGVVTMGFPDVEFRVDFLLAAKRSLPKRLWELFDYYFVRGADWRETARRLGKRGQAERNIFRQLDLIREMVGRELMIMKPYPLYPLEDYFHDGRDLTFTHNRPKEPMVVYEAAA